MKNLKFDVKNQMKPLIFGQADYRVIIAGSTHKGEDEIIFEIFKRKHQKYSDTKLLLVPRHLTRFVSNYTYSLIL